MVNKKCERCGKALVSIGTSRKNGKRYHDDWSTRKYHKRCWKEMQDEEEDDFIIESLSLSMKKLSPGLLELPK